VPRVLVALSAASILFATATGAQTDPRLSDAVRLAQDGLGDSARTMVARLRDATDPLDSLYPQILYTQGVVANNPDERRQLFRRLTVEFGTSAWADDALLGLAMLDYAAGNPAAAVASLERIDSDYPDSPVLPLAAYWAARAYFELKKPTEACRWITNGMARVGDNLELQNQLNYYQGRCAALAAQPPESTRTDTAAHPGAATQPATRPGFSVQVAAVKTQTAADKVMNALKASGFEPHTVKDAGLLKVRVGHYPDRAGAQAAAARIKTKLGGAPYVVDES
jgi:tetratricopeptide (TPR) repeat protein